MKQKNRWALASRLDQKGAFDLGGAWLAASLLHVVLWAPGSAVSRWFCASLIFLFPAVLPAAGNTTPDHPGNVAPSLTPSCLLFLVSGQLVPCYIPD